MNPRCTSGPSAASWDSIRAAELTLLSLDEVGGLWARVNPCRNPPNPALLPDSKRHAHTLRGEECPGQAGSDGTHHTHRVNHPESEPDNTSAMTRS